METLFTIYFMLDTPSPCRFLGVAHGLEGGGREGLFTQWEEMFCFYFSDLLFFRSNYKLHVLKQRQGECIAH